MQIATGNSSIDLRDMGLSTVNEGFPVRTGEMGLLDGTFYSEDKGFSARTWELGGEYRWNDPIAPALWTQLLALRNEEDSKKRKLSLSEFQIVAVEGAASREQIIKVADVYLTGSPRRDWVELLNGRPRIYRWRFRLLEASGDTNG